jgi:hypothetical protein
MYAAMRSVCFRLIAHRIQPRAKFRFAGFERQTEPMGKLRKSPLLALLRRPRSYWETTALREQAEADLGPMPSELVSPREQLSNGPSFTMGCLSPDETTNTRPPSAY